jgi:thioredoxin-like negative regulator of GroEL
MRTLQRLSSSLLLALLIVLPAGRSALAAIPAVHSPLPWIEDDFPKAVALAKARGLPIFVETWAPWCHTCRSMRAYVFTNETLARHAGDFVWLGIDTENPRNAEFCRRFPTPGIPTIFVIDPAGRTARVRWLGSMTVAQLHAFLDDVHDGRNTPQPLLARVARADSLYGASEYALAADAYAATLAAAPAGWRGAARLIESQMFALSQTGAYERAVALARASVPGLGRSSSALSVAAGGLDAAVALPESLPSRAAAVTEFAGTVHALVTDTSFAAAADDRSGAYISLLEARHDADDAAGARAVALEWSAFLDGEAARARTPEERAVFDPHRLSAYIELEEPQRAVAMLQASERDLPGDYNPPQRLATAYKAMKRWDEALACSDRAMALAYGPRKLLVYTTRADIYVGRGDAAGARRTMEEAIAFARSLPAEQRPPARLAGLQRKLDGLPTP